MVIYSLNQGGITPDTNWRSIYVPEENLPLPAWVELGNLSTAMLKQAKHREALLVSEQSLLKSPTSPQALCKRVESLLRVQKYEEVQQDCEYAIALMGEPPEIIPDIPWTDEETAFNHLYAKLHFYQGKASMVCGKREDAEANFAVATKRYPNFAEAFAGLGMAMYDKGERGRIYWRPLYDKSKANLKALQKEFADYMKDAVEPEPEIMKKFDEDITAAQEEFSECDAGLQGSQETKIQAGEVTKKAVQMKGRTIRL